MNEKIKKIIGDYEIYAKKNGFKLNPNKKIVEVTIKGLLMNEKKYNQRYCPCRKVNGIPKEDKKIICPCIYHKDEIKNQGYCYCLLFVK